MDINELLHREQVSLANADSAACTSSRLAHEGLARGYGARLNAAGFPHRPYRAALPKRPTGSIKKLVALIS
ncbi:hypothetical protein [Sphingomonas oryzagri]